MILYRFRLLTLSIELALFFLLPTTLLAQLKPNAEALRGRLDSKYGYTKRNRDERYEGMARVQVDGELLELVSLTFGEISYPLDDDRSIIITAPDVKNHGSVSVSGSSYGIQRYYYLNMELEPGRFKSVPIREVLGPNSIYADNFGVYGYYGDMATPSALVPVSVRADKGINAPPSNQILATMVPNTNLRAVHWSYAIAAGNVCGPFNPARDVTKPGLAFFSGKAINIPLTFDRPYPQGTILCIRVEGEPFNGEESVFVNFRLLITEPKHGR